MQTVADRFFEAFDALLAMGETKIQTFCREGGIDKRNFYKKRDNTDSRREIPTAWLTFIVEHSRFASLAVDRPRADVYKIARKYVKNYVRRG